MRFPLLIQTEKPLFLIVGLLAQPLKPLRRLLVTCLGKLPLTLEAQSKQRDSWAISQTCSQALALWLTTFVAWLKAKTQPTISLARSVPASGMSLTQMPLY